VRRRRIFDAEQRAAEIRSYGLKAAYFRLMGLAALLLLANSAALGVH
jgi:hypothetical protein